MNQNNNRSSGNNNRRRGRGNNRGGQGGGAQGNRIDSRARGNAPQMLEKYRKLAHDASLNGDRVQTEYYLQYADHYFRVVADSRAPRDEQQRPRSNEREGAQGFEYEEEDDMAETGPARPYQTRREREAEEEAREGERGTEGEPLEEERVEVENPFVAEPRQRRPRGRGQGGNGGQSGNAADPMPVTQPADGVGEFDAAVLPPSIAREPEEVAERQPRQRGRRRARPAEEGDGEALEAVG